MIRRPKDRVDLGMPFCAVQYVLSSSYVHTFDSDSKLCRLWHSMKLMQICLRMFSSVLIFNADSTTDGYPRQGFI